MQATAWARALAPPSAGRSRPARMAMMAMTTSNSISVKAGRILVVAMAGFTGRKDYAAIVDDSSIGDCASLGREQGRFMKERGQPCPRGAAENSTETRGQGCP